MVEWRAQLAIGAGRIGWKLGRGIPEADEFGPLLGYLTSLTRLEPGSVYRAGAARELRIDAEVALEVSREQDVVGYAAALELVDLGRPPDDFETIVAENLFHRAFSVGPTQPTLPESVEARVIVNGELRGSGEGLSDYSAAVKRVAQLLRSAGERLEAGDRIITGAIVQVPVAVGDEVVVELGELGQVSVRIG